MHIGAMSTAFMKHSFETALKHCQRLGIESIEIGTGGYLPKNHCDPEHLLSDPRFLDTFRGLLDKYGVSISALSIHGEPLHPDPQIAAQYDREFKATSRLAEKLGVARLTLLAGLPGATPTDSSPNWILCQWPPRNYDFVQWQWDERLIPYWKEHVKFAEAAGVQLCFEIHAGDLVYHPAALLRLRDVFGPIVGATLDPAHLIWQGMDVHDVILTLGDAIYHVHAKDIRLNPTVIRQEGILDPKPMQLERTRSWLFRTVGYGNDAIWWRDFVSTLRMIGYDSVLSIEHEDPLIDPLEGLERSVQFLRTMVPEKPRAGMWFAEAQEPNHAS
jgi:sugar phosphate isomerase/epimerase